ncbi:MAG: DUF1800 family protein, partial [Verrucomicrobiae bacterium]|nr:DUF1800 family protein [Verrucomicrobiae bacterium]
IPDWWEHQNALQPGTPALAAADTDGDGLSNLLEYQRGSDPRNADTDGDGIPDGAESAAGALKWDTDGDGLGDLEEQTAILPSNPLVADTDGDGVNDKMETQYFSDPSYRETDSATFTGWTPLYRSASTQWEWSFENVQLVWDHGAGALSPSQDNENFLLDLAVRNANGVDYRTMRMGIRYYKGVLTPWLYSQPGGGFSAPGASGSTLREAPVGGRISDLTSSLGFSGYGVADISDRLRFRLLAQRGSGNSWTLTYEVWNQTRNALVLQRVYANCTAAASVDNGTAGWMSGDSVANRSSVTTPAGVRVFFTPTPLYTRPQYAAYKDTDKDGIPDAWEIANGMNPLVATDATSDRDNDGVTARDEYLLGLNPRNPDSDGDGIPDGIERSNRSDPASNVSRPVYAGFVWPTGEDLNGDGLPDAWQALYSAYGISPTAVNDGDGQSNAQEALWGTNPFDPASKISLSVNVVPPDIHLNWPHQPLKKQTLFWTTNASAWVAYAADPLTDNGVSEVILANRLSLSPGELYRVDTEDVDSDGDGVSDWAEGVLGTNPFDANSSRLPVRAMTATGTVLGSVYGDYVTFVERLRQAPGLGVNQVTRSQAARFLQQATFGPTSKDLDRVQQMGFAAWIDDQIQNQPPTLHSDYIQSIVKDLEGPRKEMTYSYLEENGGIARGANVLTSFARGAIRGPDQLRQRVAFALSEILVISRRVGDLQHRPLAVADYYDIFVQNAFANYYDVLREVTFHAAMGHYLSHVGNQKAIP